MNGFTYFQEIFSRIQTFLGAFLGLFCLVIVYGLFVVYIARKMTAAFQARVGPHGPFGWFHSLSDVLKLLQKEDFIPRETSENLWLVIQSFATYATLALLPLCSSIFLLQLQTALFFPFLSFLGVSLATLFLSLGQKSVASELGGIRLTFQVLVGFFPAMVSLLCASTRVNGFEWKLFAETQGFFPWTWIVFSGPFYPIAAFVFILSGLIVLCIPPFDSAFMGSDLQTGLMAGLSGTRLLLFFLGRFYSFFLWSVMAVVLFFGAWRLPVSVVEFFHSTQSEVSLIFLECFWVLSKVFLLMSGVLWLARSQPTTRVDQVMNFSLKILSPLAILNLIGCILWMGLGQ